jgi:hypothetical protein
MNTQFYSLMLSIRLPPSQVLAIQEDIQPAQEEEGDALPFDESNIPLSPLAKRSVRMSEENIEKGYDSDGELGPFLHCMQEEGPLETEEPDLPEPDFEQAENDGESSSQAPNSTTTDKEIGGVFMNLEEDAINKFKGVEGQIEEEGPFYCW